MRISLGSFLSDSVDERNVAKSRIKRIAASIDSWNVPISMQRSSFVEQGLSSGMDYRPCTSCLVFASPIVAKFLTNSKLPLPDFCDIRFRSLSPVLLSILFAFSYLSALFTRAFAKTSCRCLGKTRCFSFLKLPPLIDRVRNWQFWHGRISCLQLRCRRKKISETSSAINQEIGYRNDFKGEW